MIKWLEKASGPVAPHNRVLWKRQRLRELLADVAKPAEKVLRLTVEAGGCSGFSYR